MASTEIFESDLFISERKQLNFKENNLTFKKLRTLNEMLIHNLNTKHLIAFIELKDGKEYFLEKISKSKYVLLTLSKSEQPLVIIIHFYSIFDIENRSGLKEKLIKIKTFESLSFKEFWE